MEGVLVWLKWLFALIGGFVIGLLGGWDAALQVLVIFVVCDYITGVAAAYYAKQLDSRVGFRGAARKILLFVPVIIAYWLDVAAGAQVLRSMAIFFYIANEGLSILENLARMDIAIPGPLKAALEQLKQKAEVQDERSRL